MGACGWGRENCGHDFLKQPGNRPEIGLEGRQGMEGLKTQTATSIDISAVVDKLLRQWSQVVRNPATRKVMVRIVEHILLDRWRETRKNPEIPPGVNDDKLALNLAILKTAERAMIEYDLSESAIQKFWGILIRDQLVEKKTHEMKSRTFIHEYGQGQPTFLIINPMPPADFNSSERGIQPDNLDWEILDRIVTEAKILWGANLMMISGERSLSYLSHGKTILDLVEKHPDVIFILDIDPTRMTDAVLARLKQLGNLSPVVIIPDQDILGSSTAALANAAMLQLYTKGIPFGVKLTLTHKNVPTFLSDRYMEDLFREKHALYGLLCPPCSCEQIVNTDPDVIPSPQQRLWMWQQVSRLIREKHLLLANYWNYSTLTDGCLAAGGDGNGGYFFIDWNGNVRPCLFLPCSPVNIGQVYAQGGNLNHIWNQPFFAAIRNWKKSGKNENKLTPCLVWDHYRTLRELACNHQIQNGGYTLLDASRLDNYAFVFQQLAGPIWKDGYVRLG